MPNYKDVKLGVGLGSLIFGLKESEIVAILGLPANTEEYSYLNESKRKILSFEKPKIDLSFDSDEEYRLVSIDIEDSSINIEGLSLIGNDLEWIIRNLEFKGLLPPTIESISTKESPNSIMLFYEKSGISIHLENYNCISFSLEPFWINGKKIKWPKVDKN